jgi:hypothetical protein
MKMTIWKCDRCGKEYREGRGRTFEIAVGTERDQIEGRTFEVTDSIDLCVLCVESAMEQFVRAMDYPTRKAWIEEVRARLPN